MDAPTDLLEFFGGKKEMMGRMRAAMSGAEGE